MTFSAQTFQFFLQSLPIGAELNSAEITSIQSLSVTQKYYPPHTLLTGQGEFEHRIFFMNSGWGCIYRDLANGDRQIIDFPLRGDIMGMRSAEGPNYNSFASVADVSVFEVSAKAFYAMLEQSPRLSSYFMRVTSRQRSIIIEHLTNCGRRSALARTAHLFLEFASRLDVFGALSENSYECPLTQYELADALGLTPIHINRMLRELRERKLVSFRNGVVKIHDWYELAALSNFDPDYLVLKTLS